LATTLVDELDGEMELPSEEHFVRLRW